MVLDVVLVLLFPMMDWPILSAVPVLAIFNRCIVLPCCCCGCCCGCDCCVVSNGNSSALRFNCETPIKFTAALSLPLVGTIPIVCILLLVTSKGYANVCANSPLNAPHCNRSMVVGSRCVMWVICRLACSLIVNATPL